MSPSLPPEILDLITEHLRDEPTTLEACCVISKSWIHRTRVHLFARVEFYAPKSHIELWKKAFPDPSTSPAHYTRTLSIRGIPPTTTTGGDAGDWIRPFQNIVRLHLGCLSWDDYQVPLAQFHGLSPVLRSLCLTGTHSEVLDLICFFPLLEDLAVVSPSPISDTRNTPSTSPKLTGSLDLRAPKNIRSFARRLLGFPGGLRFSGITVACFTEDFKSIMDLVSKCSDTLKSLDVFCHLPRAFPPASMSGRCLTATCGCSHIRDASAQSLQGCKTRRFVASVWKCERPAVHHGTPNCPVQGPATDYHQPMRYNYRPATYQEPPTAYRCNMVREAVRQEWQDLDRLLVQFWTSHSIRPRIAYEAESVGSALGALLPSLLPELTSRGVVDFIEY